RSAPWARRSGWRATRSPTRGSASPPWGPGISRLPRPRSSCAGRPPPRRTSPGPARSRPSTVGRCPISVARPFTSGTWPPNSPCARCGAQPIACGTRTPDVQITVTVNDAAHTREIEPRLLLIHFLRDDLGLTGSHWGCDTSNCGACVVWLDETPVKSCTVLAAMADGRRVTTVEGLARGRVLDPVQEGFAACHGLQCGFCTPGMMMTARWLLDRNPDPTAAQVREAISGQICRCTGYENIVRSVLWAAKHSTSPGGRPPGDPPLGGVPPPSTPRRDTPGRAPAVPGPSAGAAVASPLEGPDDPRLRAAPPQGGRTVHPRAGQVRRRYRAARHAARRRAAQPARARPDRLGRRRGGPRPPGRRRRAHLGRPGRAGHGVDAHPLRRRAGGARHRQGALPGPGGRARGGDGPLRGPRRARTDRRGLRAAAAAAGDLRRHR